MDPASSSPQQPCAGLTQDILNSFRYQVAVIKLGGKVLRKLFKARYIGGEQAIKAFLISQGRSGRDYRDIFDKSMRTALENGPPEEYDLSLLYKLMREVCGFSKEDNVWIGQGPSLMENLIQQVKEERNSIAHVNDIKVLTTENLEIKLKHLQKCILLLVTNPKSKIPRQRAKELQHEIESDFRDIMSEVREPLNPKTLSEIQYQQLQHELQLYKDKLRELLRRRSRDELRSYYPQLWDVTLAGWLCPDLKIRPSLNYTSLVIREDILSLSTHSPDKSRTVPHQDLLQVCRQDKEEPEVLIIHGEGGMGKSTTLQYLTEMWVTDTSKIKKLEEIDLFLFYQLRGSNVCSWKEMIKHLLWNTYQKSGVTLEFFSNACLEMKTLVLLDGYDEACNESKKLVIDLINLSGNLRLIITTRPGSLTDLLPIVKGKKLELSVEIMGVQSSSREDFVHNTVMNLENDQSQREYLKKKILDDLIKVESYRDCLDIPLTLTLMVVRRKGLSPGDEPAQDLYQDLTDLMVGKAVERLAAKGVCDAKRNIDQFFLFLGKIANRALKRMEYDLYDETVEELKTECTKRDLPHREVMSGFLISKRVSDRNMKISEIWAFPHQSFQEQWSNIYQVKMGDFDLDVATHKSPGPQKREEVTNGDSVHLEPLNLTTPNPNHSPQVENLDHSEVNHSKAARSLFAHRAIISYIKSVGPRKRLLIGGVILAITGAIIGAGIYGTLAAGTFQVDPNCMECLCQAATKCNLNYQCHSPNEGANFCGPHYISKAYWVDAGQPILQNDNPESYGGSVDRNGDFENCTLNIDCAEETVRSYLEMFSNDCNGDGVTDCQDFSIVNFQGRHGCLDPARNHSIRTSNFYKRFDKCWEEVVNAASIGGGNYAALLLSLAVTVLSFIIS